MRTSGIFMVLSGSAIIVFYIIYELLKVIVFIPSKMRIAVALILVGGLLVLASMIKEGTKGYLKLITKGLNKTQPSILSYFGRGFNG